jgi:hypothetical protein
MNMTDFYKELIGDLWESRNGILSTQVPCEFFVTVRTKIPNSLSIDQAQKIIGDYASSWYITNIKNYYPDLHIDDIKACVQ